MKSITDRKLSFTTKKPPSTKSGISLSKLEPPEDDVMSSYFESTLKELFGQVGSDGSNQR
jgi:hypothetical protein